jgi:hypothetical protein
VSTVTNFFYDEKSAKQFVKLTNTELSKINSELELQSPQQYILFVNRSNNRRIVNYEEAIELIHKVLNELIQNFNFLKKLKLKYINNFSEYSPEEQAILVKNSAIIISPHGAQLTNLIFGKSKIILEIFPYGFFDNPYINISNKLGNTHFSHITKRNELSIRGVEPKNVSYLCALACKNRARENDINLDLDKFRDHVITLLKLVKKR